MPNKRCNGLTTHKEQKRSHSRTNDYKWPRATNVHTYVDPRTCWAQPTTLTRVLVLSTQRLQELEKPCLVSAIIPTYECSMFLYVDLPLHAADPEYTHILVIMTNPELDAHKCHMHGILRVTCTVQYYSTVYCTVLQYYINPFEPEDYVFTLWQ